MNKIQPMKRRHVPAYPTIHEISQADLAAAPTRWSALKSAVASLGTAAMALRALALEAEDGAVAAPSVEVAGRAPAEPTKAAAAEPTTDVCPLAAVAVAGEGRGGFGCVAVNPPVMLGELEALEIIENEFLKRGVKLQDCPELDGVPLPSDPKWKRPVMLDFGTASGDIMAEFISYGDIESWKKFDREARLHFSSFNVYDFRAAAGDAVAAISARKGGAPVSVGVFYEPVAHIPKDWKPSSGDFESEWEERRAYGRQIARGQLKAQIDAFFDYLARKGKLPSAHAPDAPSH